MCGGVGVVGVSEGLQWQLVGAHAREEQGGWCAGVEVYHLDAAGVVVVSKRALVVHAAAGAVVVSRVPVVVLAAVVGASTCAESLLPGLAEQGVARMIAAGPALAAWCCAGHPRVEHCLWMGGQDGKVRHEPTQSQSGHRCNQPRHTCIV